MTIELRMTRTGGGRWKVRTARGQGTKARAANIQRAAAWERRMRGSTLLTLDQLMENLSAATTPSPLGEMMTKKTWRCLKPVRADTAKIKQGGVE